jgi:hypothetical protein
MINSSSRFIVGFLSYIFPGRRVGYEGRGKGRYLIYNK